MSDCQYVIKDLKKNLGWESAVSRKIKGKDVVVARQMLASPIVVFIPLAGSLKFADLNRLISRVKQFCLELTFNDTIIQLFEEESDNVASSVSPQVFEFEELTEKWVLDHSFNEDVCLTLYRELQNKHASILKLNIDDNSLCIPVCKQNTDSDIKDSDLNEQNTEMTAAGEDEEYDRMPGVDFHASIIFVFSEGSLLSYFQAASGLAIPQICPDDSDDEQPLEVVKKFKKKEEAAKESSAS